MKHGSHQKRGRGGHNNNNNNRPQNRKSPANRNHDSQGPDVRIRGNAVQIYDKYVALARDASSNSDRVLAENYLQHAEHYCRIMLASGVSPDKRRNQNSGTQDLGVPTDSNTKKEKPEDDSGNADSASENNNDGESGSSNNNRRRRNNNRDNNRDNGRNNNRNAAPATDDADGDDAGETAVDAGADSNAGDDNTDAPEAVVETEAEVEIVSKKTVQDDAVDAETEAEAAE